MLEFHQVRKTFGAEPILKIEQLTLAPGIYWLQGANGSGKTTLLRMIAGIVPFDGDIRLESFGQRKDPVAYRRLVGWADNEPLYPAFLTGQDLLQFYSSVLKPDQEQVANLKTGLEIGGWLNTKIAAWSSGTIKKLALLLAFLGRPALIALDEPFVTLDSAGLAGLCRLIRESWEIHHTSFLISSHQPPPENALPGVRKTILENESMRLLNN